MNPYGRPRTNEVTRFWIKVCKQDGCWIWKSAVDLGGYGLYQISKPRKTIKAHRMSFALAHGLDIRSLSPELVIRHTCDNPVCVNPEHLLAGTVQDNTNDKMIRGRYVKTRPGARLTIQHITLIREELKHGYTHHAIAARYGVCRSNISMIASKRIWKEA